MPEAGPIRIPFDRAVEHLGPDLGICTSGGQTRGPAEMGATLMR